MKKRVAFHTLGCKLNFAETSSIRRIFEQNDFEKVDFKSAADVYVINTCSVTENADKECKTIVKQALKANPEGYVVIVGCYAQLKPKEISEIEGVDLVLGAKEKFNIVQYISDLTKKEEANVHACEIEDVNTFIGSYSIGDRTRAFLKVQDGCDYSCTFCTIPLARGKSRSDSIENVVKNVREIAQNNIKEIVLTGINLGDFGKGFFGGKQRQENFFDLIQVLDHESGIERYRISSIEPNLLTDEIIEFVQGSKKFVPHFHIPLQSGSNKILKLMRRRYQRELYTERVEKIKQLMPDCCIGVDVIVGFPGETDEDFLGTYNFLNELPISYLHVFTYSERDNTMAVDMGDIVPQSVRKQRNNMLRILSTKKSREFYESQSGKEKMVLFEAENKNGFINGFTDNYVKVRVPFDESLINQLQTIKLENLVADNVFESKVLVGV